MYGLYILETVQTALCTADAMRWYAIGYGDLLALIKPQFSTIDAPILDALIAIIVQLTFCWRIRVLSKSWLLSGSIALVAVAQLVGALASAILVRLSFLPPPFILLSTFFIRFKNSKTCLLCGHYLSGWHYGSAGAHWQIPSSQLR